MFREVKVKLLFEDWLKCAVFDNYILICLMKNFSYLIYNESNSWYFDKFGGKFSSTHLSNSFGVCFLLIKVSKKDNYQFEDKEIRNLPPKVKKNLTLIINYSYRHLCQLLF